MSPTAAKQAEQLRLDGNSYFKRGFFGAAIDAYTGVIYLLKICLVAEKYGLRKETKLNLCALGFLMVPRFVSFIFFQSL